MQRPFFAFLGASAVLRVALGCGASGPSAEPDASDVDTGSAADGESANDGARSDASTMPIKHVVIIVKENHTFDNYFGSYAGGGETAQLTAELHDGTVITRPKCPAAGTTRDFPHDHGSAVRAFNDGGMNGLDLNANTVGSPKDYQAWCYFDEQNQLDIYWQLAKNYTLADRFFTTTLAPSFPGHLASAIGQSPAISNPGCPANQPTCTGAKSAWGCVDPSDIRVDTFDRDTCSPAASVFPCFDLPTWMDVMPSNLDWRVYGGFRYTDDAGAPVIVSPFNAVKAHSSAMERKAHFRDEADLVKDVAAPDMPAVLFWSNEGKDSEHPPSSPCPGEKDDAAILNALMSGPHWNDTAVLITFDDWGGFYDRVAPPVERCNNGAFYNPGFRVPLLVVSAYSKPGYVLHDVSEQASLPRFIEEVFGLPFTSTRDSHARDGKAGSLLGAFDFASAPRPPVIPSGTCP